MFILRRAVARAVVCQPSRSYASLQARNTKSIASQLQQKPLTRQFHQTWVRRAEEEGEKQEGEPDKVEPSARELQEGVREESAAEEATSAPERSHELSEHEATSNALFAAPTRGSRVSGIQRDEVSPSRILYVGNLYFQVTAEDLQREFNRFGTVTNTRVVTDPKGDSRGFGYVEFSNIDEATEAIAGSDQQILEGRRMAVQFHRNREDPRRHAQPRALQPPSPTLFVGNMSYQMTDKDLNDLFREVRDVTDVRVAIDRRSGQPRGFAHADFLDVDAAIKAKDLLEKKVIYGRQLRVDFSAASQRSQQSREE